MHRLVTHVVMCIHMNQLDFGMRRIANLDAADLKRPVNALS